MKKRILILLTAVCLCVSVLSSCSGGKSHYSARMCASSETKDGFWSTYEYCDGIREYTVTVKEGRPQTLSVEFETKEGSYRLTVKDPNGEEIYSGNESAPSTFSLPLREAGKYRVRIDLDRHSGGFTFTHKENS